MSHVCEAEKCDICSRPFEPGQSLVDGRIKSGQWATMCADCHRAYGVGLGTGKGQLYAAGNPRKLGG